MEPKILEVLLILLASIIIPTIILVVSTKKPPQWLSKGSLAPFWSKINFYSFTAALVLSGLSIYIYRDYILEIQIIAATSIAAVTMIFGQTLFTDFNQRLADRRMFRVSNIILLLLGGVFLYLFSEPDFVVYVIILLFTLAIFPIPAIGDSDARALQLAMLALFPVAGVDGIKIAMIIFLAVLLLYILSVSIKRKNFKLVFISKISIPAVPFILLPVIGVLLAYPMLNI